MTQCYTDTEYASFTRQTIEHACDPLIQRNLHDGQYLVDNPLDSTLDLCRTEPLKDVIHHVWPQVIAARCDAHDDGRIDSVWPYMQLKDTHQFMKELDRWNNAKLLSTACYSTNTNAHSLTICRSTMLTFVSPSRCQMVKSIILATKPSSIILLVCSVPKVVSTRYRICTQWTTFDRLKFDNQITIANTNVWWRVVDFRKVETKKHALITGGPLIGLYAIHDRRCGT